MYSLRFVQRWQTLCLLDFLSGVFGCVGGNGFHVGCFEVQVLFGKKPPLELVILEAAHQSVTEGLLKVGKVSKVCSHLQSGHVVGNGFPRGLVPLVESIVAGNLEWSL